MAARCEIGKGPGQAQWEKRFFDPTLRSQFPILLFVKPQPDELDLFDSSFRTFSASVSKGVFELPIVLDTVGWEDGSGYSWNFTGRILGSDIQVHGVYSTKTSEGWVVFETKEEKEQRELFQAAEKISNLVKSHGLNRYDTLLSDVLLTGGWLSSDFEQARRDGLL